MTLDQALIAYLTGMVVTVCFLGATGRLPGQHRFKDKTTWVARRRIAEELERDVDASIDEDSVLRSARRDELTYALPLAVLLWPVYLLGNFFLSVLLLAAEPKDH